MKKIKYSITSLILIFTTQFLFGQEFQIPKNYSLEKNEDYAKLEKEIISCINWLEKTPVNEQSEKRKEANAFLLQWISGHPTITTEISESTAKFTEGNPELLMIFMGGWTKFVIENPGSIEDHVKGNFAGIKSSIAFYKKNLNNGLEKNKDLEKLISLDEKGELEKWVYDNMKK